MKRFLMLAMGMLLATGCYQTSDTELEKQTTPSGNAADSVALSPDTWTVEGCIADSDCAGKFSPGYCEMEACVEGTCKVVPVIAGTTCYDPTVAVQACQVRVCKPEGEELACKVASAPDGLACGVFYASCGGTGLCNAGNCVDPCIGTDPCKTGSCTSTGCQYEPTNEGTSCNDDNTCTANDMCTAGVCVGTLSCQCANDADCVALDDANLCNGTLICKQGQCQIKAGTVVACEATGKEPCLVNACNPGTGLCEEGEPTTPTPCDDGEECTKGDQCQDGTCSHFANITCEYLCDDDADDDDDGKIDCLDPECFGQGDCPTAGCGDDTCNGEETCVTCEEDCGVCPPECGDGECNGEETCDTCGLDCGACPAVCGDDVCELDETCETCEDDCGVCASVCGDGTCQADETCEACESDCGVCPSVCGDGTCQADENCNTCDDDCVCTFCAGYAGTSSCCTEDNFCSWDEDEYCDCSGTCTWDSTVCVAAGCGDGTCDPLVEENCSSCSVDCGVCVYCAGYTGGSNGCMESNPMAWDEDGYCDCDGMCAWDVVDCTPVDCGDGTCQETEDCGNCEADCGACDFCTGYTGNSACCQNSNPCGYDGDEYCDCDGFCTWDSVDCAG